MRKASRLEVESIKCMCKKARRIFVSSVEVNSHVITSNFICCMFSAAATIGVALLPLRQ
jgi:hypothetical protein